MEVVPVKIVPRSFGETQRRDSWWWDPVLVLAVDWFMGIGRALTNMIGNAVATVVIGTMVGLLSGMFGVGGGFILTPLLFFMGIPPAVAVASATALAVNELT